MDPLAQLLGESPGIIAVREQVRRLLQRQAGSGRLPAVLIQGATGTGKGLVARALHGASGRAAGPFIDVNCAAIPETLLESEMFGVERGAFTDARQSKPGLFQLAHRGTIFLDEIGLLPEALQAKLLKVIEERAVRRLGGTRSEPVDVWVIAATNEDLDGATRAGRFRADLYHRLAVVTFALPALSERGEDVLLLAEHFLARACADYGIPAKTLAPAARAALRAYPWPGNIRELANVMERVALLTESVEVTPEVLALPAAAAAEREPAVPAAVPRTLEAAVGDVEREHLLATLTETRWNVTRAAERLGVSRNTLRYRIEKHGLKPGMAPSRRPRVRAPAPSPAAVAPPALLPRERRRLALLRALVALDPESDVRVSSRHVLDLLADKVGVFGGRVEELNPSGIVAVFGLEPVEDAPIRASHAAIAIVNGVERARATGARLGVRLGIHVDQFMVERTGGAPVLEPEARLHAWAFLDSLVAGAGADGIAVSEAAAPFLERRFDLIPLGFPERGPDRVFRLAGREGPGPGLRLEGRMTRFVGRQHEFDVLRGQLELARQGEGQVVGIVGDAGIGKSRLLFEFSESLVGQGLTYLVGQCVSYGSSIPYLPVLDAVRKLFGLAETDTPVAVREKLGARLAPLDLNASEPYLLHLLGIKEGAEGLASVEPEEIRSLTFETLRQVMLRSARQQPLILVAEDMHWIDRTSEQYYASLGETLAGVPILLVATYRAGYRPPWIDRSYATQIAIQPLRPEHGMAVVRSILGPSPVEPALAERILAKAEGNPFFLEEMARSVREQALGEPGAAIPATIHEVVRARIDRLPPEDKHVLQVAAVVGKDVPLVLLEATAGLPGDMLRQGLARLRAAEFLYERSAGGDGEYAFKHALTHEVAYASVPPERRQAFHVSVVDAVERLYGERLAEHVDRLALHALGGELWDKALLYCRQAGQRAFARSAHQEAVSRFEQALTALERLPPSDERLKQAIDLRLDLRYSLVPLGRFRRILDYLREAEDLAERLGDLRRRALVAAGLTNYFLVAAELERALAYGHRALTIAEALNDPAIRGVANSYLAQAYHTRGEYRRAIDHARRNVASLEGDLIRERFGMALLPSVYSRTVLVMSLSEVGEIPEAVEVAEQGLHIAETVNHPYSLVYAYLGAGVVHLRKGERDRAVPVLEQALGLSQGRDIAILFSLVAPFLGAAYTLAGRAEEGVALLEEATRQAAAVGYALGPPLILRVQAEAYLAVGRLEEAEATARRAVAALGELKLRGHEGWAWRALGDITTHRDPAGTDGPAAPYRRALALAEELGMRPLAAHCHLGLGGAHLKAGRMEQAREALQEAAALFRSMGLTMWLTKVEQGLARVGLVQ